MWNCLNRLISKVLSDYNSEYSTASIAQRNGISAVTAARIFDKVSYPLPNLPRVLSIDEFKGNAGGRKYQCILADPVKRKVLDILPSKNSEDLITYFLQFPLEKRKQVQYLVMDMSLQFPGCNDYMFSKCECDYRQVSRLQVCNLGIRKREEIRAKEIQ
ncbi:MAG: transposase [Anaerovoracaceae bacterium]